MLDWFDGKMEKLDDAIVAEVEVGLGPAHRLRRPRQRTTLFLDSQIVKWNVEKAIAFHKGDKNAKYVVDRIDVHYQPGHINASQSETKAADGRFLAVGCKFSRTASCPWAAAPENEQLIDISGEKMVLLADHPVRGEAARLHHLQARPPQAQTQVYTLDEFPLAVKGRQGIRRVPQRQRRSR